DRRRRDCPRRISETLVKRCDKLIPFGLTYAICRPLHSLPIAESVGVLFKLASKNFADTIKVRIAEHYTPLITATEVPNFNSASVSRTEARGAWRKCRSTARLRRHICPALACSVFGDGASTPRWSPRSGCRDRPKRER